MLEPSSMKSFRCLFTYEKEIIMSEITKDFLWDYLVDQGVATEEELQLVTCINGFSVETLNDVIYARTGYRNYYQLAEEEEEEGI